MLGGGVLSLDQSGDPQYAYLPAGILPSFSNLTIEVWFNATDPASTAWQRVFDFGSDDGAGSAATSLNLTPAYDNGGPLGASLRTAGMSWCLDTSPAFNAIVHAAVVVDDVNNRMIMYRDGAEVCSTAVGNTDLSSLDDVNNYIGRSQFAADVYFTGEVRELRIYGAALSADLVLLSFQQGENPAFLE